MKKTFFRRMTYLKYYNIYPCREEIEDKIYDLVNLYTIKHSKVLFIRFDLHYPFSYPSVSDNKDISSCMAYVIKKYKRLGLCPAYIWVREQNYSEHPHYHVALLLDGQKIHGYHHVFVTVEAAWERTLGCPVRGCVHHCTDPNDIHSNGIMLRRDDTGYDACMQKILNILSYLAKSYTKPDDRDGLRNFGCTKLYTI